MTQKNVAVDDKKAVRPSDMEWIEKTFTSDNQKEIINSLTVDHMVELLSNSKGYFTQYVKEKADQLQNVKNLEQQKAKQNSLIMAYYNLLELVASILEIPVKAFSFSLQLMIDKLTSQNLLTEETLDQYLPLLKSFKDADDTAYLVKGVTEGDTLTDKKVDSVKRVKNKRKNLIKERLNGLTSKVFKNFVIDELSEIYIQGFKLLPDKDMPKFNAGTITVKIGDTKQLKASFSVENLTDGALIIKERVKEINSDTKAVLEALENELKEKDLTL